MSQDYAKNLAGIISCKFHDSLNEIGFVSVPILWVKNLRLKKVKQLTHGYTVRMQVQIRPKPLL